MCMAICKFVVSSTVLLGRVHVLCFRKKSITACTGDSHGTSAQWDYCPNRSATQYIELLKIKLGCV